MLDVNALVNAQYDKDLGSALAADAVTDEAERQRIIAAAAAELVIKLKAALDADALADASAFKAKDDRISALEKALADCQAGEPPVDPPPPPPPPPTGFPNASNTGSPKGSDGKPIVLPAYTGPMTISAAGTVIDGKTITGPLRVTGANVVIKNCKQTFSGYHGIFTEGALNPTIQDCTIIGPGTGSRAEAGIKGSGNFLRNDISKTENGIVLLGGKSVVKGNYIHDLLAPGSDPHYDGLQIQGGQNGVLIEDNAIFARDTSDIIIQDYFGPVNDVTVNHNYLGGNPGINVYVEGRFGKGTTNVRITNNVCKKGSYSYWSVVQSNPTFSGNIDADSGAPIAGA